MAKQIGDYKITGTIAGITFYKMEDEYYARMKSSLEGKRVKKDPRFKRTMEWAHRLARGSQLASRVYRSLPREEQEYALYKELKSLAIKGLKEGRCEEEILEELWCCLGGAGEANSIEQPQEEVVYKRAATCCRFSDERSLRRAIEQVPAARHRLLVDGGGRLVEANCVQHPGDEVIKKTGCCHPVEFCLFADDP